MADIAAQIQSARKDGYSDAEIMNFLGTSRPDMAAKIKSAQQDGYQPKEIVDFLSTVKQATPTTAGTGKTGSRLKGDPQPSAFFDPMVAGEKQVEQGVGKLGTGVSPTIGGLSDIFRGGLGMAYPYAAALSTSSLPALTGTVLSIPVAGLGQFGSQALGASEDVSHAVGDVTGLMGGYLGSKLPGAVNSRTIASLLAKLPHVPLPVKLGLKAYGMTPPPESAAAGEYLKHGKEAEPGNWGIGMGVSPKGETNPPPDWLKTLQSFTFKDMEQKLRDQSQASALDARLKNVQSPPIDPFPGPTKRVGGFGRSKVSRQNAPVTESFHDEQLPIWPPVEPLPEKMGPPPAPAPVSPPPPPVFDTKRVGGFGNTRVPSTPITPTVTDLTPPPQVDLPPEISGPGPAAPYQPPQSMDISGVPREPATPPVSTSPPPVFGSPEWEQAFKLQYPDLPVPKPNGTAAPPAPAAPPVIEPKKGSVPGAVSDADVEAEVARRIAAAKAQQITPKGTVGGETPAAPPAHILDAASNAIYHSPYEQLTPQARATMDGWLSENNNVPPTMADVESGKFKPWGREALPSTLAPPPSAMENPPKVEETPVAKPAEPEVKTEEKPAASSQDSDKWPQRYRDMIDPHGRQGAEDTLKKDTDIAQHLLDNNVTPDDWRGMTFVDKNKLVKAARPQSRDLGKGGKRARPADVAAKHIEMRMQELMTEKGITPPPEPKATAQPPAEPSAEETPPPPKPVKSNPMKNPPPETPPPAAAAQPGAADPGHTKVARWLIDERDITPDYWKKISDTEKQAYINLAGQKVAQGNKAFDTQDIGIGKELRRLSQ